MSKARIERIRALGSLALSLALHGLLVAPLLLVEWDILDPDDLGLRGARQWAEEISVQSAAAGGKAGVAVLALEGREGVIAVRLAPFAPEPPEEESEEALTEIQEKAEETEEAPTEIQEKAEEAVEEKEIAAPAEEAAAKGEDVPSAETRGEDAAKGEGEGGSDKEAEGLFVSGKEIREVLSGWTLIGTNGFADGSIGRGEDVKRQPSPWRVYYAKSGRLQARFVRRAAAYPHGPLAARGFFSSGEWWIKGDWLCQRLDKWFSGASTCFEIRRQGQGIAMYYAECWGVARCYRGRLGPEGVIVRGRRMK